MAKWLQNGNRISFVTGVGESFKSSVPLGKITSDYIAPADPYSTYTGTVTDDVITLKGSDETLTFTYNINDSRYYLTDIVRTDGYEAHYGIEYDEYKLGKDQYFMMGDNSENSLDSRFWGPVPRSHLMGTAGGVFWPFSHRWGFADTNKLNNVETTKNGSY